MTLNKATPAATLAVNNSPATYDGTAKAATVAISASSVPGAVANILTGGSATRTNAGTYAVTADFVPTDTTNYNTLVGLAAGNFAINKATPTATLAVNNSPVMYDGTAKAATVVSSASSVPGAVANILAGGSATKTAAGTYGVTADFVPTDTGNYNSLPAQAAGNFVINKATPSRRLQSLPQRFSTAPRPRSRRLGVGCWMLDVACWMLHVRSQFRNIQHPTSNFEHPMQHTAQGGDGQGAGADGRADGQLSAFGGHGDCPGRHHEGSFGCKS